jgi:hypothetical protein
MRLIKYSLLLSVILLGIISNNAFSLKLVESGTTEWKIYAGKSIDSVETYCIKELSSYIKEISGAELTTTSSSQGKLILLGTIESNQVLGSYLSGGELSSLGPQGFIIRQSGDKLIIAGGGKLGLVYGIYDFLEELGVRWYMPTKLGEVIPKKEDIVLEDLNIKEKPSYRIRSVYEGPWALRNKLNTDIPAIDGVQLGEEYEGHNLNHIIPADDYYSLHPEYFGWNGSIREPAYSTESHQRDFCTSSPEVRNIVVHRLKEKAKTYPYRSFFALKRNDGLKRCECSRCVALDEKDVEWVRQESRRYLLFWNQVASEFSQSYPDNVIDIFAYHGTLKPPKDDIPVHPNLLIELTHQRPTCDYNHPIRTGESEQQRIFRNVIDMWAERSDKLGLYEYYYKVAWCLLPFPIIHSIRDDIPYFYRKGGKFFHTQSQLQTFGNLVQNYYLAARLTWDVESDVDSILNNFYHRFYGEAAEPMKKYYEGLERAMIEQGGVISHPGMQKMIGQALNVFTPEILNRARKYLTQARARTNDSTILKRIHLSEVSLDYTTKAMEYLRYIRDNNTGWEQKINWRREADRKAADLERYLQTSSFPELMNLGSERNQYDIKRLLLNQHEHLHALSAMDLTDRTKLQWIIDVTPDWELPSLGEKFDLCITGEDFESDTISSEHLVYSYTRDGDRKEVGKLSPVGSGIRGSCLFKGLDWCDYPDDSLVIEIHNPRGKWMVSVIHSIYVLPNNSIQEDEIDRLLKENIGLLRSKSYGFLEIVGGEMNEDGQTDSFIVEFP